MFLILLPSSVASWKRQNPAGLTEAETDRACKVGNAMRVKGPAEDQFLVVYKHYGRLR